MSRDPFETGGPQIFGLASPNSKSTQIRVYKAELADRFGVRRSTNLRILQRARKRMRDSSLPE